MPLLFLDNDRAESRLYHPRRDYGGFVLFLQANPPVMKQIFRCFQPFFGFCRIPTDAIDLTRPGLETVARDDDRIGHASYWLPLGRPPLISGYQRGPRLVPPAMAELGSKPLRAKELRLLTEAVTACEPRSAEITRWISFYRLFEPSVALANAYHTTG